MSHYELDRLHKRVKELEKENQMLHTMNKRVRILLRKANEGKGEEYLAKLERIMKLKEQDYA